MWLVNNYGHHGENAGFQESIVAVMGVESESHGHFLDCMDDGTLSNRHLQIHPRYPHSTEPTAPMQGSHYSYHQKLDNRNTIFRGRGPMYPPKPEYEYHQREYYNYPPFPSQHSPQPLFHTSSNYHGDPNFDPKSPKSPRKRDRAIEAPMRNTELSSNTHLEPNSYAPVYLHNTPTGSMIPFMGLEEAPNNHSSIQNKNRYEATQSAPWNESSTKENVPASHENKCGPTYPHLGEKLTWQQSYENLKVYKKTYGDCNVPQKYKENPKLGGWVNKQRKKKKNPSKYGRLTESQTKELNDLGFKWNLEGSNPNPSCIK